MALLSWFEDPKDPINTVVKNHTMEKLIKVTKETNFQEIFDSSGGF